MSERLENHVAAQRAEIEAALRQSLPVSALSGARRLNEALDYAVFPGGKRLRPVLALLASDLAGATRAQGLQVACAVEFLHSSSLIFDDLPAMDDAHLRRNRRALHLVYGEGVATLAAVALLNQSYALLAEAGRACLDDSGAVGRLIAEAARCVGADGMVGGQVVDLETRACSFDDEAHACRDLKTGALMRLMVTAGALACAADEETTRALADFGDCFGRAYQICDDISDELCASDVTGKPARQDARHLRANIVSTLGVEGARRFAEQLIERGVARLAARFGERREAQLLADAARHTLDRLRLASGARASRPRASTGALIR